MSQSINNSSGRHQGHLAGFLLGSYSLRRTPQVLNTFFKRQLLNAERGTLSTVFQLLQVFSPLHCVKCAVQ